MRKTSTVFLVACLLLGCVPAVPDDPGSGCSGGTWQPGWLEIHHIDAGEAVSTLLVSPAGKSLLIDAGEAQWDGDTGAKLVGEYVRKTLGCARLDYVVISHFHLDHVGFPGQGGLWHLAQQQGFAIGKLLHRDLDAFAGTSSQTLAGWRDYLHTAEAASLSPEVATLGEGQVELGGGVRVAFVAVDGNGVLPSGDLSSDSAPPDENDYSIGLLVRFGRLDYLSAGDLSGHSKAQAGYSYHDIETFVAPRVKDVDVYRVSHHGSQYASNQTLLAETDPEVSIVQVGDDNRHGHPTQAAVDRLLATSALYLTEHGEPTTDLQGSRVVGDVVVRTSNGIDYTVAGDAFAATDPARTDADQDGYFVEADPDDLAAWVVPAPQGSCDVRYQACP